MMKYSSIYMMDEQLEIIKQNKAFAFPPFYRMTLNTLDKSV